MFFPFVMAEVVLRYPAATTSISYGTFVLSDNKTSLYLWISSTLPNMTLTSFILENNERMGEAISAGDRPAVAT